MLSDLFTYFRSRFSLKKIPSFLHKVQYAFQSSQVIYGVESKIYLPTYSIIRGRGFTIF